MSFDQLNLHPKILKAIQDTGYTVPTPVQSQAIPVALNGGDILASAQTGTGKTAAFMLPALNRLTTPSTVERCKGPRVLVLSPTRELAMQISDSAHTYGKYIEKLAVVNILGGMSYTRQRERMSRPVDIMIATPGRLLDYLGQKQMDFRRLELLVLDEADRMLDMGFRDAVKEIVAALPSPHQTLLFSATGGRSMAEFAGAMLNNPTRVQVSAEKAKHENIDQKIHYVRDLGAKKRLLTEIMEQDGLTQAIIFTATKRSADELADALEESGHEVASLHGDMHQRDRTRTVSMLREGEVKFLIATDVAARGIDVRSISHIINFDIPRQSESYVHRIGRTGRAGAKGTAITFAYPHERRQVSMIESYTGQRLERITLPGFEVSLDERQRGSNRRGRFQRQRDQRDGQNAEGRGQDFRRGSPRKSYGSRSSGSFVRTNEQRPFRERGERSRQRSSY